MTDVYIYVIFILYKETKIMKASKIIIEITNLTTKTGSIFNTYSNITFDNAYKAVKKEFKGQEIIIESVKCKY